MGSEWKEIKLGELGSLRNGANFNKNDYGSDFPVVSVKNLFRGRFVTTDGLDAIKIGVIRKIDGYLLKKDDILFARSSVKRSGAGQAAIVGEIPINCIFSGFIIRFRVNDSSNVIPLFLFYLFKTPQYRELFTRIATGTTISNLSQATLSNIDISLPPLSYQLQIANIIGTLDDRIELNRRMNETLESMAQALFKSWFVDFDPVIDNALASGREIPEALKQKAQARAALGDKRRPLPEEIRTLFPDEFTYSDELGWIPWGWEVGSLEDEIDFATGPAFKSKDFSDQGVKLARGVNVKEGYFQWGDNTRYWPEINQDLQKHELKSGDVLIGMDGSKVGKNWVRVCDSDLPCLLVQRVARLRPKNSIGSTFLDVLIGGEMFKRYVENVKTGTSIPHISGGQIKNYPIVNPYDEGKLFRKFEKQLEAAAKKREGNLAQIITLSKLRDTLLPKLLSGELRIPDAEKMVEELA